MRFDEAGNVLLDFSQMPEGATRAISEIVQDEYVDGKGEDARLVKRTRFKLHGKQSALDSLAKHLGMYSERRGLPGDGIDPARVVEEAALRGRSRRLGQDGRLHCGCAHDG